MSTGTKMPFDDNKDPPWKKEIIMKKRAVSRKFEKCTEACDRTDSTGSIATKTTVKDSEHQSVSAIGKRRTPVPSPRRHRRAFVIGSKGMGEDKKMPTAGSDPVLKSGSIHINLSQTSSDATYSDYAQSPTLSSTNSDAFSFESDLNNSCDIGELQYGPGIVNKLKSRFIHLHLKETKKASMIPPLSSGKLRRFSSLEGLVDSTDSLVKSNMYSNADNLQLLGSSNRSKYYQNYNSRRNNMKKARSLENLGIEDGNHNNIYGSIVKSNTFDCDLRINPNPILINENVVIIENNARKIHSGLKNVEVERNSCKEEVSVENGKVTNLEDPEMPKPDIVKTYKRIFESKKPSANGAKKVLKMKMTKSSSKVKSNEEVSSVIKKENRDNSLSNASANHSEDCKSSKRVVRGIADKIVYAAETNGAKQLNASTPRIKCNNVKNEQKSDLSENNSDQPSLLTNASNDTDDERISVTKKETDEVQLEDSLDTQVNVKTPNKEDVATNGERNNYVPKQNENLPSSDMLKPLPSKSPKVVSMHSKSDDKPVANIKPIINAEQNDKKNKINKLKSSSVINEKLPIVNGNSQTEEKLITALSSLPKPRTWHKKPDSGTSIVFDFRDRKDVKPHISNKVAPFGCRPTIPNKLSGAVKIDGLDGAESNDYDPDDDECTFDAASSHVEPCDVEFEGALLVVGKSSILANRNKQLRIQFDDKVTATFEYPSEESGDHGSNTPTTPSPTESSNIPFADDEVDDEASQESQDEGHGEGSIGSSLMSNLALGTSGALANYTPNSLGKQGETYQLGVSRHVHDVPPSDDLRSNKIDESEEEYLKPAEEDQTSSWSSSASTSDLLF